MNSLRIFCPFFNKNLKPNFAEASLNGNQSIETDTSSIIMKFFDLL